MIYLADANTRRLQYEFVDKLGRLQALSNKVDVGYVGFRNTPIDKKQPDGRGAFQMSLFNP